MLQPDQIERALAVMAHPDDVDFGAAGTVANLTDAGVEVVYCLVTDGQAGGFDHSIPRNEMARIRRREQTEAAAKVGVTRSPIPRPHGRFGRGRHGPAPRHQRRHPPGSSPGRHHAVPVAQSRFDLRLTSRPLATGEATMCAVYPDARNPFAFPGHPIVDLDDWSVDEVWIPFGPKGDGVVDITDQLDRKIEALMCHRSQHRDPVAMEERVRTWWQGIAAEHGLPEGASAEAFRVVDTR